MPHLPTPHPMWIPITDCTLVTYLLNGLNERFDNIINVIRHRDPFPYFATPKSMLQMEETRPKRTNKHVAQHSDQASSSTALTNFSQPSNNAGRGNHPRSNGRGSRRDGNRNRGCNNQRYYQKYYSNPPSHGSYPQRQNPQQQSWAPYMSSPAPYRRLRGPRPQIHQAPMLKNEFQPRTDFAAAFKTMTLGDPIAADWYMDSGATSHLASTTCILNSNHTSNI